MPEEKIRVIPQGIRILPISSDTYTPHEIPEFCYAGAFYEKIRNPSEFLSYLSKLRMDFRFHVYARNSFALEILERYRQAFGQRLIIHQPIPREELIHVMAHMDFLVNMDNDNAVQRPSKLIDYAMSCRPIFSFRRSTFDANKFQAFLRGDYHTATQIDLAAYDIKNIADQFEQLFT